MRSPLSLTKAGFDVVDERRDVGVVEFKRAVREFLNSAANADIAVVYYSGHGIEVGGTNYLIPVDAKLASDFDIDDEAIPLERIMSGDAIGEKAQSDHPRRLPRQSLSARRASTPRRRARSPID